MWPKSMIPTCVHNSVYASYQDVRISVSACILRSLIQFQPCILVSLLSCFSLTCMVFIIQFACMIHIEPVYPGIHNSA